MIGLKILARVSLVPSFNHTSNSHNIVSLIDLAYKHFNETISKEIALTNVKSVLPCLKTLVFLIIC